MDEDVCEYFYGFGLSMPAEVKEYLIESGKKNFRFILLVRFKKD